MTSIVRTTASETLPAIHAACTCRQSAQEPGTTLRRHADARNLLRRCAATTDCGRAGSSGTIEFLLHRPRPHTKMTSPAIHAACTCRQSAQEPGTTLRRHADARNLLRRCAATTDCGRAVSSGKIEFLLHRPRPHTKMTSPAIHAACTCRQSAQEPGTTLRRHADARNLLRRCAATTDCGRAVSSGKIEFLLHRPRPHTETKVSSSIMFQVQFEGRYNFPMHNA